MRNLQMIQVSGAALLLILCAINVASMLRWYESYSLDSLVLRELTSVNKTWVHKPVVLDTTTGAALEAKSGSSSIMLEEPAIRQQVLFKVQTKESSSAPLPSPSPSSSTPKFAYAFLVTGCDPDQPDYRFFLYDIVVAARLLRDMGSKGDIVIMIQMLYSSTYQTLPDEDLRWLSAFPNIKVRYIPKAKEDENYYRTQFHKFRILNMTEYPQGVLYLDADTMPINNLDFIFESSIFKDNVVIAGDRAPSNGGFFKLKPGPHELDELNDILATREKGPFDPTEGWGHAIDEQTTGDYWQTRGIRRGGSKWDFYAAYADQGLLYHWVKYAKKNVTIVSGARIGQWGPAAHGTSNGTVQLEEELYAKDLERLLPPPPPPMKCWKYCRWPLYRDFVHFGHKKKPWLVGPPRGGVNASNRLKTPLHLWFWTLSQLNDELGLGLDFSTWSSAESPFGLKPEEENKQNASFVRLE